MENNNELNQNKNITSKNNDKNYEILPEDDSNYDISYKVIVIGNSGN